MCSSRSVTMCPILVAVGIFLGTLILAVLFIVLWSFTPLRGSGLLVVVWGAIEESIRCNGLKRYVPNSFRTRLVYSIAIVVLYATFETWRLRSDLSLYNGAHSLMFVFTNFYAYFLYKFIFHGSLLLAYNSMFYNQKLGILIASLIHALMNVALTVVVVGCLGRTCPPLEVAF